MNSKTLWPVQSGPVLVRLTVCTNIGIRSIRTVPKLDFTTHKKINLSRELNILILNKMSQGFLMMCLFGFCGLTCNCSVANRHVRGHDQSDVIQPFEIALDRSARDLIGYNRQRNAAFQIRQKLFEKTRGVNSKKYGPGWKYTVPKLKIYGLFAKNIRSFDVKYTVL